MGLEEPMSQTRVAMRRYRFRSNISMDVTFSRLSIAIANR